MLTTSRPVLLLGEASYSLYLIHRPVQVLFGSIAIGAMTLDRGSMLAVQLAAVLCAVPLSIAMYHAIERPGIVFGRKIARRLPDRSGSTLAVRT